MQKIHLKSTYSTPQQNSDSSIGNRRTKHRNFNSSSDLKSLVKIQQQKIRPNNIPLTPKSFSDKKQWSIDGHTSDANQSVQLNSLPKLQEFNSLQYIEQLKHNCCHHPNQESQAVDLDDNNKCTNRIEQAKQQLQDFLNANLINIFYPNTRIQANNSHQGFSQKYFSSKNLTEQSPNNQKQLSKSKNLSLLKKDNQQREWPQQNTILDSVKIILEHLQSVENKYRILKKDFQRVDKINQFMLIGIQKKDQVILSNSEEILKLKEQIHSLNIKYQKFDQMKESQLKKQIFSHLHQSEKNAKSETNIPQDTDNNSNSSPSMKQKPNYIEEQQPNNRNRKQKNKIQQQYAAYDYSPSSPIKSNKKPFTLSFFKNIMEQQEQKIRKKNGLHKKTINPMQSSSQDLLDERMLFIQHSTEFNNYGILLDMNMSDEEIKQRFFKHRCCQNIQENCQNETALLSHIQNGSKDDFSNLVESINYFVQGMKISVNIILKLKKIIWAISNMHSSLVLQDAFQNVVNETCRILECDRASVFLIDQKSKLSLLHSLMSVLFLLSIGQELWTKVAKGSENIRLPMGQGLVGEVVKTNKILNILDAHQDERFNSSFDIKNNYNTKNVLCCPIIDMESKQTIGVLQAINKLSKKESDYDQSTSFFTKDDEGLIQILSQLSSAVLRNSLYNDERLSFHNSLRILLKSGLQLSSVKTYTEIIDKSLQILKNYFDTPAAKIFIYNTENNKLFNFSESGERELQEFDTHIGILGHCFHTWEIENVNNCKNSAIHNPLVDLDTQQPIICIPIKGDEYTEKTLGKRIEKMGIIQMVNPRGIENLLYHGVKNLQSTQIFYESLQNFSQILACTIANVQSRFQN